MIVELYINSSPSNYVTKSISLVDTLEGTLRNPTSIIDPVITIERDNPIGFNYVRIPDFNRYYFVTGIASVSDTLISISMHCDVLMSYATSIKLGTAIIRRQENAYNLMLDDGIFKAYQNTKHKIIKFPYGFNTFSYILVLAGNGETN